MKYFTYDLDERHVETLFVAIRDKTDVIRLLMNSIKIMLIKETIPAERKVGEILLHVDKMSRIFFRSDDKFFSVNFPFSTLVTDVGVLFSSKLIDDVDHKVTSEVLSLINGGETFTSTNIYEFIDPILSTEDFSVGFWSLIRELIFFEDGYLRYDYDPVRQNGHKHPLNHIDLFYSSGSTFKIGLKTRITLGHLIDLVNTVSDCHYLNTGAAELK